MVVPERGNLRRVGYAEHLPVSGSLLQRLSPYLLRGTSADPSINFIKIMVFPSLLPESTVLTPSIMRESLLPEAIFDKGLGGSPGLVEIKN